MISVSGDCVYFMIIQKYETVAGISNMGFYSNFLRFHQDKLHQTYIISVFGDCLQFNS